MRTWYTQVTSPNMDRLIELAESGMVDPVTLVTMCAKRMGDSDVGEMLDANELSERFLEQSDDY